MGLAHAQVKERGKPTFNGKKRKAIIGSRAPGRSDETKSPFLFTLAAAEERENGPVLALAMVAMEAWLDLQRRKRHVRARMEEMLRLFDCMRQCDMERRSTQW
ncbi:hypothetical protein E2542_SST13469 [Spatholobus suberectus]|nr:hypothetical protein E2542_SST13469 [Spatholobus suberectus]